MTGENDILESWKANACNWIQTVTNQELESRRLVTDNAIVQAVMHYAPARILDLGCGEGWLSRALRKKGLEVWGTDGIAALVENAIAADGPFYYQHTYEEIAKGRHALPGPFDAVVINFALLDKDDSESLLVSLPRLLKSNGLVFIQTLHPFYMADTGDYRSGWKEGSWNGIKREFVFPYLWYFRTFEDWAALFSRAGMIIKAITEPVHPQTGKPLSTIFTLKASRQT